MSETLILERTGAIASIMLNRPEKGNAFTTEWTLAITDFLRAIDGDDAIRCLVIRANGRHFMSGGDMTMIRRFLDAEASERQRLCISTIEPWNVMMEVLDGLSLPVIARVQGAVVGPAIGFASACDMVLAADTTTLIFAHVLNGGSIDGQLTYYLPRVIGPRKTFELCATGARLSAAEARDLGLVNSVHPEAELDAAVAAMADKFAGGPTRAYGEIKRLIRASSQNSLGQQSRLEAESCGSLVMSADWNEGVAAFLEKRKPVFQGR